jgi:predicted transcriptional regulator of viral defense system
MTEVTPELRAQVLEFFVKKNKMLTSRDVANGLGVENSVIKKVITEFVKDGKLEFVSAGGATFIKLPD